MAFNKTGGFSGGPPPSNPSPNQAQPQSNPAPALPSSIMPAPSSGPRLAQDSFPGGSNLQKSFPGGGGPITATLLQALLPQGSSSSVQAPAQPATPAQPANTAVDKK